MVANVKLVFCFHFLLAVNTAVKGFGECPVRIVEIGPQIKKVNLELNIQRDWAEKYLANGWSLELTFDKDVENLQVPALLAESQTNPSPGVYELKNRNWNKDVSENGGLILLKFKNRKANLVGAKVKAENGKSIELCGQSIVEQIRDCDGFFKLNNVRRDRSTCKRHYSGTIHLTPPEGKTAVGYRLAVVLKSQIESLVINGLANNDNDQKWKDIEMSQDFNRYDRHRFITKFSEADIQSDGGKDWNFEIGTNNCNPDDLRPVRIVVYQNKKKHVVCEEQGIEGDFDPLQGMKDKLPFM